MKMGAKIIIFMTTITLLTGVMRLLITIMPEVLLTGVSVNAGGSGHEHNHGSSACKESVVMLISVLIFVVMFEGDGGR